MKKTNMKRKKKTGKKKEIPLTQLEKELDTLSVSGGVALLIVSQDSYEKANTAILKFLVNQKKRYGAYVAINKSYLSLKRLHQKKKIANDHLLFLDCVSGLKEESDNCIFLGSMESLTNLALHLDAVYKIPELSFVLFDSLDTLSLYHATNMISQFSRSLVTEIKEHKKQGIILALHEDTSRRLIADLTVLCDVVLHL